MLEVKDIWLRSDKPVLFEWKIEREEYVISGKQQREFMVASQTLYKLLKFELFFCSEDICFCHVEYV